MEEGELRRINFIDLTYLRKDKSRDHQAMSREKDWALDEVAGMTVCH